MRRPRQGTHSPSKLACFGLQQAESCVRMKVEADSDDAFQFLIQRKHKPSMDPVFRCRRRDRHAFAATEGHFCEQDAMTTRWLATKSPCGFLACKTVAFQLVLTLLESRLVTPANLSGTCKEACKGLQNHFIVIGQEMHHVLR